MRKHAPMLSSPSALRHSYWPSRPWRWRLPATPDAIEPTSATHTLVKEICYAILDRFSVRNL